MKKKKILMLFLSCVITLVPLLVGILIWNKLPERVATNFAINGEATGYSSKTFAVVGLPIVLVALNLFCFFVTIADPKRKNISINVWAVILSIIPICSLFCGLIIYKDALGMSIDINLLLSLFLGLLFVAMGLILPKCKQNYTVGIKLPWTLNSEENWNKTHALGGKVWTVGGVILTITGLLGFEYITFIGIFILALIPMVYSYLYYRKNESGK